MAEIKLTIPDAAIQRIITAFTSELNYQDTITQEDGTVIQNPETKAQFTKRMVIEHVKQVTRNYEANLAASQARQTVDTDVNSISIT